VDSDRQPFELILEALAVAGVLFGVLYLAFTWSSLPARIPTHFGATGRADGWGSRTVLLMFPALSLVLWAGLTVLNRYPRTFNYPWPITAENARRQYGIARSMIVWLKFELVWMFAYIEWRIVLAARGDANGLGVAFIWVVLGAVFGSVAVHIYLLYRVR
jgi:uncharacterized membrane protein